MKFASNLVFKLKNRRLRRRSSSKNKRPQVNDQPNELILDGSSKTTRAQFNDLSNEPVVDSSPKIARTQSNDIPNEPLLDTSSGMARPWCNDLPNELIPDTLSKMARPQFNDLPNELILEAFSKLRWTVAEVRSYCLISRRFCELLQPLLYSECRLAGDSAYIPFVRTVTNKPDLAAKVNHLILCPFVLDNSKETIELLRTHIPAFLRPTGIEWYPCDPWNPVGPNSPFGNYLAKPVCLLEMLLSRLPNVQRIDFFNRVTRPVNGFLLPDTSRSFRRARDPRPIHNIAEVNLEMQHHRQNWNFELAHSIIALPNLTRLSLRNHPFLKKLVDTLPSPALKNRSLRLTYCKVNTSVLCSILEACEALEFLSIDYHLYVVEMDWEAIGSRLARLKSSLEHLSIVYTPDSGWMSANFRCLPSLRDFLRLHTIELPAAALMDPMRYEHKEMLAMSFPSALRKLFIHNAALYLEPQLAAVAEMLPRRFPRLTDVYVAGSFYPPTVSQSERSEQTSQRVDTLVQAFAKVGAKLRL